MDILLCAFVCVIVIVTKLSFIFIDYLAAAIIPSIPYKNGTSFTLYTKKAGHFLLYFMMLDFSTRFFYYQLVRMDLL